SSPLRGDRGAADDRFYPWPQTIPIERFDHGFLAGHGRRQQSGDADDVGIDFFGLGNELLGGHAGTEIEDLESAGGKNGGDQVLANVVNIASGGAEDDSAPTLTLGAALQHLRFKDLEGRLHGL